MQDSNSINNNGQLRPSVKDLPEVKTSDKQEAKDSLHSVESKTKNYDTSQNGEQNKTIVEFNDEEVPVKDEVSEHVKHKKKHWLLKIVIIVFAIAFFALCIFGIWNRWLRYDDEELFISKWQISGTTQIVIIDKKHIDLGPDAKLNYTLDTGAKVINYTIGDKSGQSHYRFSWNKNQLAIIENCPCDPISTLFSDIKWFWDWSTCGMSQIDLSPAYTKNNREEVDLENTGITDIMDSGKTQSILMDRVTTKTSDDK